MRVLAIDTALAACSAAVLDTVFGGIIASESLPMVRGHAEALIPLIARVMARAELGMFDIDRVTVTTGPGSFTGLRVGISAARGIALAADKPAFGVSTLSAYAAPHLAEDKTVPVIAAIDARHSHVYLQVFGPSGRTALAPAARAVKRGRPRRVRSTLPARRFGSAILAELMPAGAAAALHIDARDAPDIDWVARMGAVLPEGQAPPNPLYLRAADAQPQNAAQLPRR